MHLQLGSLQLQLGQQGATDAPATNDQGMTLPRGPGRFHWGAHAMVWGEVHGA
jgi:hypothetical protein